MIANGGKMAKPTEITFEQALEALDSAVTRLEAGSLSLEEAVAVYEEGQRLARLCNEKLDAAEIRLTRIGDADAAADVAAKAQPTKGATD